MLLVASIAGCSTYHPGPSGDRERAMEAARRSAQSDAAVADDAASPPPPAPAACGDGRVALTETCDIAIPFGHPGACPIFCPPLVDCVVRRLEGSNCQAQCVVLAERCADDDGCCPEVCASDNDADCSRSCGDGVVQASQGETCEPASAVAPCATLADCDDGDPCTADVLVGGESNCNAQCSHARIRSFASGDGCCPHGADASSDSDCTPECGNGVREGEEECDGEQDCDAACRMTLAPEQSACLDLLPRSADACDHCSCTECAMERLDCVASGDAARDVHCAAIITCANASDCVGPACYCADEYCWRPGPCRAVIDAAADADPGGGSVTRQTADPDTAIGRAWLVGACKVTRCEDSCP